MRALLLAAGIALACGFAQPAAAQSRSGYSYPVCLKVYGPATYDDCRYRTMQQCRISASGRSAQCLMNPFYVQTARGRWRDNRKWTRRLPNLPDKWRSLHRDKARRF